jgi:hypothetical protein
MTDEQLQAIRERLERRYTDVDLGTKVQRVGDAFTDIAALLDDVTYFRALETELRRKLAKYEPRDASDSRVELFQMGTPASGGELP